MLLIQLLSLPMKMNFVSQCTGGTSAEKYWRKGICLACGLPWFESRASSGITPKPKARALGHCKKWPKYKIKLEATVIVQ